MKKIGLFVAIMSALIAMAPKAMAQQDAQFSQYIFNGIYINPAYAGYRELTNVHAFYRNQWTGFNGAPKDVSIAVDGSANDGNVGLALQIASDRLGAQDEVSAYGNYAYRLRLNADGSSRLAFGLGVGVVQNKLNGNLLDPNDANDEQISNYVQKQVLPTTRFGVFFNSDRFYAGVSADNVGPKYFSTLKNDNEIIPVPRPHYYLTAGLLVPISTDIQIKPSFLLKDDRSGPTSLDLNAMFLLGGKVWIGGSYRTGVKLYNKSYLQNDLMNRNALIGMIELFAGKGLRIGYAYDQTVSSLRGYTGGSHEISVSFAIQPKRLKLLTPRYF